MTNRLSAHQRTSRVLLVEDQPLARRGLELLVNCEPDLHVCGEAEDADEAFVRIQALRPDVVLVDLTLKNSSGLDLITRLRETCPWVRILVVSMHDQPCWIGAAFNAGAHGYVTKDKCAAEIIRAIREVLGGRRFVSESVG